MRNEYEPIRWHDIEEVARQRLTSSQERREGPDDGPSRACRAEKVSILAVMINEVVRHFHFDHDQHTPSQHHDIESSSNGLVFQCLAGLRVH
jgi:hypothetical protein